MKEALKVLKDTLDSLNIELSLYYGTALGAYRDNDFAPKVTDIDISTFGLEDMDRAKEALKNSGFVENHKTEPRKWLNLKYKKVKVERD